jgi:DNA helicase II / ATP-dependent DNA helicase PcrA
MEASWQAGDRVTHAKFGDGTVVSVQKRGEDVELSVAFDAGGLKRLLQSMAPLSAAST